MSPAFSSLWLACCVVGAVGTQPSAEPTYRSCSSLAFEANVIASSLPTRPYDAQVADLDGDGDKDVVACASSAVYWYENDGQEAWTAHLVSSSVQALYASPGDLDGDADLDIVISQGNTWRTVVWLENVGGTSWTAHELSTGLGNGKIGEVRAVDVDSDSDIDILFADEWDDYVAWFENTGTGTFTTLQYVTANFGGAARSVVAGDVDGKTFYSYYWERQHFFLPCGLLFVGDGDLDVVAAGDYIKYFKNDGAQIYTEYLVYSSAYWVRFVVSCCCVLLFLLLLLVLKKSALCRPESSTMTKRHSLLADYEDRARRRQRRRRSRHRLRETVGTRVRLDGEHQQRRDLGRARRHRRCRRDHRRRPRRLRRRRRPRSRLRLRRAQRRPTLLQRRWYRHLFDPPVHRRLSRPARERRRRRPRW